MTYASPAIDLQATKADRKRAVLMAGGAALALGSIGVTVTSVLYALSAACGGAAGLPARPGPRWCQIGSLDLCMRPAQSGSFQTSSWLSGCSLVAFELVQRERSIAAAGWIAMFLSIVVFTFVDAIGGYVVAPLAG